MVEALEGQDALASEDSNGPIELFSLLQHGRRKYFLVGESGGVRTEASKDGSNTPRKDHDFCINNKTHTANRHHVVLTPTDPARRGGDKHRTQTHMETSPATVRLLTTISRSSDTFPRHLFRHSGCNLNAKTSIL